MITTLAGQNASRLALAAHPNQDPRCVRAAWRGGINMFFFYGPNPGAFGDALAPLARKGREDLIIASGSGSRRSGTLRSARRKILDGLRIDVLDIFFAEYVNPADDAATIFGRGGVLDEMQRWKEEGHIRYCGATAHDRKLAARLASDPRVDVLMHRFNMAHRKAAREVFPRALAAKTPVVAFTATRWGSLLTAPADWADVPPSATDCYLYCLSKPAVAVVLTAPGTAAQLKDNLAVLSSPPMTNRARARWERYGDFVHAAAADRFETEYP